MSDPKLRRFGIQLKKKKKQKKQKTKTNITAAKI